MLQGILHIIKLQGVELNGEWTVYGYPLDDVNTFDTNITDEVTNSVYDPVLFEGSFVIPENNDKVLDTFLDPTTWSKVCQ